MVGGSAAGTFGLPGPRQQAVELMGFDAAGDDLNRAGIAGGSNS